MNHEAKDNAYGSIEVGEEQPLNPTFVSESTHRSILELEQKNSSRKIVAIAATLLGLSVVYHVSTTRSSSSMAANANMLLGKTKSVDLPSYLVALDETDPEWDENSWMLTSRYVIGDPGKGNMIPDQVALVKFVEPHFVFRTYGGENKARQCGYWWVMNPPAGDKDVYFDHFAICPEWNDASYIIRCRVPVGYIAAVGAGQSVDCPESGGHLSPDPANLQLNGNICSASVQIEKHLSCTYCSSNDFDLAKSACSNNGPSYIDGFEFSN
mmetsp:Transcript_32168/g.68078  ORF Transcript_32168/g.68078 Transcript_32168/m.68078 type:complete len:268 (+) Transcript_32168:160-963(+)|eukprot:CAMPEP_0183728572 /NCGR_PEP_ID=MMETSP0737-20130205/28393_1 /TAXON_ID=385413 /ORGANISM="Thalassiosira miniscula, Strain CCMP1093" /LENGTH=267 /DNA_ID=CAMNT_0025960559 /DNA_START=95 /DNA_END=898 /DNA_ORIENTATION=-